MGKEDKKDRTGTSSFSDEVMDEMDDLEATAEMAALEELPQDDDAKSLGQSVCRRAPEARP